MCTADFGWAIRNAGAEIDTFAYSVAYASLFVSEAEAVDPYVGHAREDLLRIAGAMKALMAVRAAAVNRIENAEVVLCESDSSDPDL